MINAYFFYKELSNDQFWSCKYTYVNIFSRFIEEISYDFHVNKIEQWFNIRHFWEPEKKAGTWALVFSSLRSMRDKSTLLPFTKL